MKLSKTVLKTYGSGTQAPTRGSPPPAPGGPTSPSVTASVTSGPGFIIPAIISAAALVTDSKISVTNELFPAVAVVVVVAAVVDVVVVVVVDILESNTLFITLSVAFLFVMFDINVELSFTSRRSLKAAAFI